jgi:hypothetical protein
LIRDLVRDPICVVTRGSNSENRGNLAPAFFDQIIRKYEGTRLGGCSDPFRSDTAAVPRVIPSLLSDVGVRSSDLFVSPLKLGYLTFRFFAGDSVTLLNLAKELISLAFDNLPIVVGQPAPLLLGLSD